VAIVKANYRNRASVGRIGRSVTYYTWREDRYHPGRWQASDGRPLEYEQVWREVTDRAHEAGYTYRVMLSTRDVELDADDYARVLDGQFADWYLTAHHAGDHPHAHAIAFSDHRLGVRDLQEMRAELAELELGRERALERDLDVAREW
jgi:hypothetical protein